MTDSVTSPAVPAAIRMTALGGIPAVNAGDDLAGLIHTAANAAGLDLGEGILVVCQKIISKAEGRTQIGRAHV